MEDLFHTRLPDGEVPGIQLCIFPHLKEFLAIDLRGEKPDVRILDARDVFVEEFFLNIESDFSQAIRQDGEFPFADLMNLPLRVEEIIRENVMAFILDAFEIHPDDLDEENDAPNVMVFIVGGGAFSAQSENLRVSLHKVLSAHWSEQAVTEWEHVLSSLIDQENDIVRKNSRRELSETLAGDAPDYYSLWETRN